MKPSIFSSVALITFIALLSAVPVRAASEKGPRLSPGELPPPRIIAPAERAELRGADHVTFIWQAVRGAAAYHLVMARDRRFRNVVAEDAHVGGTSYTVGNLNYGTYFMKISSVTPGGTEGPFSHRLSFIVVPPPPAGVSTEELTGHNH